MAAEERDVRYQTQVVKSVRGMESRTAAKWQGQGWEVVSTKTGKLSSELTIRRPKPKTPWKLYGGLGGVMVVLIVVLIVVNAVKGSNATADPADSPSPSASTSAVATPNRTPSAAPKPTDATPAAITATTNPEFAALLALTDSCSQSIATFAAAHMGATVEFDGFIGAMAPHDGARTRYDILINDGDFDPDHSKGPSFQYRDVNATYDLHWSGARPDTVGIGNNLHFVARIDKYEESTCLFLLDPVQTSAR